MYLTPFADLALVALSSMDGGNVFIDRARRLERDVHEEALATLGDRPLLARSIACAAFVDRVWQREGGPVAPLRALWSTGYVLGSLRGGEATLLFPPI